jgi:hypothetical protein
MNNAQNETVNITKQSAWACMELLTEILDWVEFLDEDTRKQIIALDELVRALDAERFITDKKDAVIAERQREWKDRQAKENAESAGE